MQQSFESFFDESRFDIENVAELRWSAFFSQFDFILLYRRGDLNVVADALSRRVDLG